MRRYRGVSIVVGFVMAMAVAGCGSTSSPGAVRAPSTTMSSSMSMSPSMPMGGSMSATSNAPVVSIHNFAYTAPATVKAGATIKVTNTDGVAHTVTSDQSGAFDVNVPAQGSATFVAPSKPGTYAFHCTYHSNMHGSLIVN